MTELSNGTTVIERSCERLVNYLDGQIGKTFSGSFCYEKKLTNYGRKLGKECMCVKNLCNSATDIDDTDESKLMKVLKTIQSDIQAIKKSTCFMNSQNMLELRSLTILVPFYVIRILHIDKIWWIICYKF